MAEARLQCIHCSRPSYTHVSCERKNVATAGSSGPALDQDRHIRQQPDKSAPLPEFCVKVNCSAYRQTAPGTACTHMHAHKHTHARTRTRTRTHTPSPHSTRTHTHTRTRAHTHTHARTCAHIVPSQSSDSDQVLPSSLLYSSINEGYKKLLDALALNFTVIAKPKKPHSRPCQHKQRLATL